MWLMSIFKKKSPEQLSPGEFDDVSRVLREVKESHSELREILDQQQADISTINTAYQRIERKQNRWLEIINDRNSDRLPGETQAPGPGPEQQQSVEAGEPEL